MPYTVQLGGPQLNSSQLSSAATLRLVRADRCRSVADVIDHRRVAVTERHEPVVALHCEEVWRGRAATASRTRMRRVIGAALYSVGLDLAATSSALRGEASRLEQEAAALQRQASALAAAEAAAEARAESSPEAARSLRARASAVSG